MNSLIYRALIALHALSPLVLATPLSARQSGLAGWHTRALPNPSGSNYEVEAKNLVFGVFSEPRSGPDDFEVAFFRPNVAIDARGQVLTVDAGDFAAITSLATEVSALPLATSSRNLWAISHAELDQSIKAVTVATPSGPRTHIVYGHNGQATKLEIPVADYTHLPNSLNKLLVSGDKSKEDLDNCLNTAEGRQGAEACTGNRALVSQARGLLDQSDYLHLAETFKLPQLD